TLDEEGTMGRGATDEAGCRDERVGPEADAQDLVAALDDLPRDGGAHHRRPRRPKARARLHLRVDGRPQARRVRPHADLPGPLRRRHGPGEGVVVAEEKKDTETKKAAPKKAPAKKPATRKAPAKKTEAKSEAKPKTAAKPRAQSKAKPAAK